MSLADSIDQGDQSPYELFDDWEAIEAEEYRRAREARALTNDLVVRVQGLEMQVFLTEQFLEATLMLWHEERERVAFLEDALAGVLEEGRLSGVREVGR